MKGRVERVVARVKPSSGLVHRIDHMHATCRLEGSLSVGLQKRPQFGQAHLSQLLI